MPPRLRLAAARAVPYPRFYERREKRAVDLLLAVPVAILSAPLAAIVGLLVWAEDRGPAIFRQVRVGRSGDHFTIRKFRTMPVDTPNIPSASAADARITHVGRILRRTSLDEIPQIMSVLSGDMSVVGPRPPIPVQEKLVALRRNNGSLRLRPGLTGLAQVNSFDGMTEEDKAAWDARYANTVSLTTDLRILMRTVGYLLRKPPQY